MSGELGKCPTCKKEVSTGAKSCPHCGETGFLSERKPDENDAETEVVMCSSCAGKGYRNYGDACRDESNWINPFATETCSTCNGSGHLKKVRMVRVELRTGKKQSWGTEYQYTPRPASSGCASIVLFALSLAASFLIAFFW